jgi:hypothetical protein
MSTTVRDASLITLRNRNKAVNAYASSFRTANQSAAPQQGLTAPGAAGAETVAEAVLGCTACTIYTNELIKVGVVSGTPDRNLSLYPFNPSSGGAGRTY